MNRAARRRLNRGKSRRLVGASLVAVSGLTMGYVQVLRNVPRAYAASYCGAGAGGVVDTATLNAAIADFNAGNCDTISVGADFTLTGSVDTIDMAQTVASELTIEGSGAVRIIGGASLYRPFEIVMDGSDTLTVSDLTLSNCESRDDATHPAGGALSVNPNRVGLGEVNLDSVKIEFSDAHYVNGANNYWMMGGGAYLNATSVSITDSNFSYNQSWYAGGGAWVYASTVSVTGSVFARNKAGDSDKWGYGGGLYIRNRNTSDTNVIDDVLFNHNYAYGSGGGLFVGEYGIATPGRGNLTIRDSSFLQNYAGDSASTPHADYQYGGAVAFNVLHASPGGVETGVLKVYDTDFDMNRAGRAGNSLMHTGGGAVFSAGETSLIRSTFTMNGAGGSLVSRRSYYSARGGAVLASGDLEVEDSAFTGNIAGYWGSAGDGGAIYSTGANSSTLTIRGTTLAHNRALSVTYGESRYGGKGGAIATSAYTTVRDSAIIDGTASEQGGGVSMKSQFVFVYNSYVGGNTSDRGAGGFYGEDATLLLRFSTVYANSTSDPLNMPTEIFLKRGGLSALGAAVANPTSTFVINDYNWSTNFNMYSVSTSTPGTGITFSGPGSLNVSPGTLQLASRDGVDPGHPGRAPAASSVLMTAAPNNGLGTGLTSDQIGDPRADTWTIGSRQFSARTALVPVFDIPVRTRHGFTVNVTNWDGAWTWLPTVSTGRVAAGTPVDGVLPLTVTELPDGASAIVTVTATRAGYPDGSAPVTGRALPAPAPSGRAPRTPSVPEVIAGDGRVRVSVHRADAGAAPTGFRITATAGGLSCAVRSVVGGSCVIDGLDNGTDYAFRAVAINAHGVSNPSEASQVARPGVLPNPGVQPEGRWLPLGSGRLTVDGRKGNVTLLAKPGDNGLDARAENFAMRLVGLDLVGTPIPLGTGASLVLRQGGMLRVKASGFHRATRLRVFALDRSGNVVRIGSALVGADGTVRGEWVLPATMSPGDWNVQAVGVTTGNLVRALTLGVTVLANPKETFTL